MAFTAEAIAKLKLDTTDFQRGLTKTTADFGKAGQDINRKLQRAFGAGDAVKGILQGIGIASVSSLTDFLVSPFQRGAERAKLMAEETDKLREVTVKEIAALNGQTRALALMRTQYDQITTDIEIQQRLVDELNASPLTFITEEGRNLLRDSEKDLSALRVKQAEVASEVKVTTELTNRRVRTIQRQIVLERDLANAELKHGSELEKIDLRRDALVQEFNILKKEGATNDVLQANVREQVALGNTRKLIVRNMAEKMQDVKRAMALDAEMAAVELRHGTELEKHQVRLNGLRKEYNVMKSRGATSAELQENRRAQDAVKIQMQLVKSLSLADVAKLGGNTTRAIRARRAISFNEKADKAEARGNFTEAERLRGESAKIETGLDADRLGRKSGGTGGGRPDFASSKVGFMGDSVAGVKSGWDERWGGEMANRAKRLEIPASRHGGSTSDPAAATNTILTEIATNTANLVPAPVKK